MGIQYTGTGYLSSAMAMDKGITKWMFQMYGVPVPGGVTMKKKNRKEDPVSYTHLDVYKRQVQVRWYKS